MLSFNCPLAAGDPCASRSVAAGPHVERSRRQTRRGLAATRITPVHSGETMSMFLARRAAVAWYASHGFIRLGFPPMLRACSRVIALSAVVVALSSAQAATADV